MEKQIVKTKQIFLFVSKLFYTCKTNAKKKKKKKNRKNKQTNKQTKTLWDRKKKKERKTKQNKTKQPLRKKKKVFRKFQNAFYSGFFFPPKMNPMLKTPKVLFYCMKYSKHTWNDKYTTIESGLFYFLCCLGTATSELDFWAYFSPFSCKKNDKKRYTQKSKKGKHKNQSLDFLRN